MRPDRALDVPWIAASRVAIFGAVCLAVGLLMRDKASAAPFAVGAPLFAFGMFTHVTSRDLRGLPLLAGTALGLGCAVVGALLLSARSAALVGGLLAVAAVATVLRLPALLGDRAPAGVGWIAGRETPLLVLGASLGTWAATRARAGADAILVDWMALTVAVAALVVLLMPRPRPEWADSPGRRHRQNVQVKPDPRAAAWRVKVRTFLDSGEGADAYAAEWRRALVRRGLPETEADEALLAARKAPKGRGFWQGASAVRRREIHASLVELLRKAGNTNARNERL